MMPTVKRPLGRLGVRLPMQSRPARSRLEVDLLPPFGEPEVVTTGQQSPIVALVAIVGVLFLAARYFK